MPTHIHAFHVHLRGTNAEEYLEACVRAGAVIGAKSRWRGRQRSLNAQTDIYAFAVRKVAHVAERQGVDAVDVVSGIGIQSEFTRRLLDVFGAQKDGVFLLLERGLKGVGVRQPFARRVVLAKDESRCEIGISSQVAVIQNRGRRSVLVFVGARVFWRFEEAIRGLQRQIARRIPRYPARIRVQTRRVEGVAIFVWLAAIEGRTFDFDVPEVIAQRRHSESDMRRIFPVMGERGIGIIHARSAVHERGRAERRFAGVTKIQVSRTLPACALRIGR